MASHLVGFYFAAGSVNPKDLPSCMKISHADIPFFHRLSLFGINYPEVCLSNVNSR